ncbi:MAG: tetratricopeptide repeat protein [Chitinophagaceae bacterium]|nr:tetratricopeptide repeat protein [Chitinophagaceae bacterium]
MPASKFTLTTICTILFCCVFFSPVAAQKDATLDVEKPEKYENRVLGSDKTFTTRYTVPRRLLQSMSTHYNYFFNANIKIENVITGAKLGFKEDYTELLPFYNYTLDATSSQKTELDSVLQKCNAGILLHDLRNEWIDDMYLLMGKAYFLKKQFDSAGITFQYLNYYFQPKTKEELGFKKFVGSNLNDEGNVYSVSTKEKNNVVQKAFSEPPRRNDALVWQLRTFIEDSAYGQASALIQTLRRDELFPQRLKASLEEMQAYLFYKSQVWDSAAHHLVLALDNAADKGEQARWEYLVAQLYTLAKNKTAAENYYQLSIKHTVDPILDVYARLNIIKLAQGENDEKIIEENIQQLLKMAKRDKYYNYRSIIYYMAAQMEMQRDNFENAKNLLLRAVKYNPENLDQRNRSYLYLGDMAFDKKQYQLAFSAYDSLDANSPVVKDPELIKERKTVLAGVVERLEIIRVEDSLQRIAAMPEAEREKLLKAVAKKLAKERGLKEQDAQNAGMNSNNPFANKAAPDLFAANNEKGDWYFYNNSAKGKGFTAFRNTWGTRPNVDNWRRMSAVTALIKAPSAQAPSGDEGEAAVNSKTNPQDISYEGLLNTLPLTEEAISNSNDTIQTALFELGKAFKDKFEDYAEAVKKYEELLDRFPESPYQEEALLDLNYCYTRLGLPVKAKQYRDLLAANFKQSKYLEYIDDPKGVETRKNKLEQEATRNYEKIYDLFIEGHFEEALLQKQHADSIYGQKYWSQQLLYIEAIYYIQQREDDKAIEALQNLAGVNREAPISKKAENIIRVLKKRAEIEEYLATLEVERAVDDSTAVTEDNAPGTGEEPPVAVEEKPREGVKENVITGNKPRATDVSTAKQPPLTRPAVDSSKFIKPVAKPQGGYSYNASDAHYVVIVLNRVDVVYINEAKNAFSRYNRETYYGQPIEIAIQPLDEDNKLLLLSGFADMSSAIEYVEKAKKVAGSQVVPWLAANKYSFTIISEPNLQVLKDKKDLEQYKNFVETNYPVQF